MRPFTHMPGFTDPRTTPFVEPRSRGELPHLYKDGGSYFVTMRLWDAVGPREDATGRDRRTAAEIGTDSEPPLRLGTCLLARPEVAAVVQSAMRFFDGRRYKLAAWCVMPNHAHAVFTPFGGYHPPDVLHSWKSFTAHRINELLGRTGAVWERESFDHLIRSPDDFVGSVRYVEDNPVAAGLCERPEDWPWSSARVFSCCGAGVPPASRSHQVRRNGTEDGATE